MWYGTYRPAECMLCGEKTSVAVLPETEVSARLKSDKALYIFHLQVSVSYPHICSLTHSHTHDRYTVRYLTRSHNFGTGNYSVWYLSNLSLAEAKTSGYPVIVSDKWSGYSNLPYGYGWNNDFAE